MVSLLHRLFEPYKKGRTGFDKYSFVFNLDCQNMILYFILMCQCFPDSMDCSYDPSNSSTKSS